MVATGLPVCLPIQQVQGANRGGGNFADLGATIRRHGEGEFQKRIRLPDNANGDVDRGIVKRVVDRNYFVPFILGLIHHDA